MKKNHSKISTQLNMSLEVEGLEQFMLVRESLMENWYALLINDLLMVISAIEYTIPSECSRITIQID